ncbi:MAG: hypothetical protein ACXVGC_00260 [Mycobacteriaceae bacterium]
MAASEAAVTAVMKTLGCEREYSDFDLSVNVEYCNVHEGPDGDLVEWTDRGCPVAVAAADAAVDADRASIQAETLREAASEWYGDERANSPFHHPLSAQSWLYHLADQIEAQP